MKTLSAAVVVYQALALPGLAGPLTCETFKVRLPDAVSAAGDKVAQVKTYVLRSDADNIRNYDWHGIVGLEGSLECDAKDDRLIGFRIVIATDDKNAEGAALPRMRNLASAAVCSLADAIPRACDALVDTMVGQAADQMEDNERKGEPDPKGSSDFDLTPHGWWASVSVDDTQLVFGFGSGTAGTEERLKLAPVDTDR